jgi:hypothetical protein
MRGPTRTRVDIAALEGGDEADLLFCIKWVGRSHLHNSWHTAAELRAMDILGLKKLQNFAQKWELDQAALAAANSEQREYIGLQRSMMAEVRVQQQLVERVVDMREGAGADGETLYLCKWQGLPYRDCTWELASDIAPFHGEVERYQALMFSRTRPNASTTWRSRPAFRRIVTQPSWLGAGVGASGPRRELRDYQLEGINWLARAWCRGNSVILADEMGLGKTIQTAAFLAYLFHVGKTFGPFLIVVPLSTVMAWQRELRLWAPAMNVVVYLGDRRSREILRDVEFYDARGRPRFNVLLTTYEIAQKDCDELTPIRWAVLAVDEAHRLKNNESQLYVVLSALHTAHRLLITGTPMQV